MTRMEKVAFGSALAALATPAFAGVVETPAPVAGLGIGAVVLTGMAYRALKSRISR